MDPLPFLNSALTNPYVVQLVNFIESRMAPEQVHSFGNVFTRATTDLATVPLLGEQKLLWLARLSRLSRFLNGSQHLPEALEERPRFIIESLAKYALYLIDLVEKNQNSALDFAKATLSADLVKKAE